jgi:hypothetical protein
MLVRSSGLAHGRAYWCGRSTLDDPVRCSHELLGARRPRVRRQAVHRKRLRTGAPWRNTPDRYDNWNSVYVM